MQKVGVRVQRERCYLTSTAFKMNEQITSPELTSELVSRRNLVEKGLQGKSNRVMDALANFDQKRAGEQTSGHKQSTRNFNKLSELKSCTNFHGRFIKMIRKLMSWTELASPPRSSLSLGGELTGNFHNESIFVLHGLPRRNPF